MNAELAERVAALEAERLRPVPRRQPTADEIVGAALARIGRAAPISVEEQAKHRADLLAALRNAA